jgi:hypothetical protein
MKEDFRPDLAYHFVLFEFQFSQRRKGRWQSLETPLHDVRFVVDCLIASNYDVWLFACVCVWLLLLLLLLVLLLLLL